MSRRPAVAELEPSGEPALQREHNQAVYIEVRMTPEAITSLASTGGLVGNFATTMIAAVMGLSQTMACPLRRITFSAF